MLWVNATSWAGVRLASIELSPERVDFAVRRRRLLKDGIPLPRIVLGRRTKLCEPLSLTLGVVGKRRLVVPGDAHRAQRTSDGHVVDRSGEVGVAALRADPAADVGGGRAG